MPTSASGAPGYSVHYGYEVRGLQTSARFGSASGPGVTNSYDAVGRLLTCSTNMDGTARTLTYTHDAHGNRTSVNSGAGYGMAWFYDPADRMTGGQDGNTILQIDQDAFGRRQALKFWNSGLQSSPVAARLSLRGGGRARLRPPRGRAGGLR